MHFSLTGDLNHVLVNGSCFWDPPGHPTFAGVALI